MKHLVTIDWLLLVVLLLLLSREGGSTDDDVAVLVTRIESSSTYHQRITHRHPGNVVVTNRNSNARQHPFLYKKDYKHWLGLKTGPSI